MLAVLVNTLAVLLGSTVGLLARKGIPEKVSGAIMTAISLCTLYAGVSGMLKGENTLVLIVSMVLGTAAGTLLDLDGALARLGKAIESRFRRTDGKTSVAEGFVTASLLFCIGAMAIVGSIQDGILGDHATLFAKAVLDLVIIMVMTASMGKGCIFSAIPVGILQGSVTLLARLLQPVFTDAALSNLSLVGSVLVFCVGLNLVWGKKIRVANLLPSLLIAVIWAFL